MRDYLRALQRRKIEAEAQAFGSMHAELVKTHLGQYIAIYRGRLIDQDEDFLLFTSELDKALAMKRC